MERKKALTVNRKRGYAVDKGGVDGHVPSPPSTRLHSCVFGDSRMPQRFWDKVSPEPNSGCWLWTASLNAKGYGRFNHPFSQYAHRSLMYVLGHRITQRLQIDHLCKVRSCVNPQHLEVVTPLENNRRSPQKVWRCGRGHLLSRESTGYVRRSNNARLERICYRCVSENRGVPRGG